MDFDLDVRQQGLKRDTAEFGAGLNDGLAARDDAQSFSRESWMACAKQGLLGLPFPKEHGGQGEDLISTVAALGGLGYGCRDAGLIFGLSAQMWSVQTPILEFGSKEQKRRYLPRLIDGSIIGAHAMTEAESGSDAFALSTTAEMRDGEYVLNGSKTFVTSGPEADVFIVFATVNKSAGFMGVTAFVIDRDTPGLKVSEPLSKMGLRTVQMCELTFDDARVPADALLGGEGKGAAVFNSSMEWERAFILAPDIGAMEYQLERCLDYAWERRQAGRPIGEMEPVANRLADMKTRLETARLLTYRTAWLKQTQGKCAIEAAMTKLYVSEAWLQSCLDAIRIHGGRGFMTADGVERDLRDSVGGLIYSGTSDIQRNIISRLLLAQKR